MSYQQGIAIGNTLVGLGQVFTGALRDQRKDARETEGLERDKRIKSAAYNIFKDPEHNLGEMPIDEKFDATREAAILKSDTLRQDREYEAQKAVKRSALRHNYLDGLQKAEMALNSGDVKVAANLIAQISPYAPTGWNANYQEEGGGNAFLEATNTLTGETKRVPVTKESLNGLIQQGKQWRDTQDFDTAAKETDGYRRRLNEELTKAREIMINPKTKKPVGVRHEALVPSSDGRFTMDRRWVYLDNDLKEAPPGQFKDAIPESTIKVEQGVAKAEADVAKAGYEKDLAKARQGVIGAVDLSTAVLTQGGDYVAKTNIGGTATIPADKAPAHKVHMLGGGTNAETGEQTYFAQEDPYKTKVSPVKTGVKTGKLKDEDPMVSVPGPSGGKPVQIKRSQVRSELKEISSFLTQSGSRTAGEALAALMASDGGDLPGKENKISQIVALSKDSSKPEAQQMAKRALTLAASLGWIEGGGTSKGTSKGKPWYQYLPQQGSGQVRQPIVMP